MNSVRNSITGSLIRAQVRLKSQSGKRSRGRLGWRNPIRYALAVLGALTLLIGAAPLSRSAPDRSAGGSIVLVTERAPLPLSDQFTTPNALALTNGGDVYFNPGASALFRWNSVSGTRDRIVQEGDPHPGLPGTIAQAVAIGGIPLVNSVGHVALINSYVQSGVRNPSGVFVYDGTSFQKVILSSEPSPTPGMQAFTGFAQQSRLNDNDEVAFTGFLEPNGPLSPGIFLGSPSSPTVKIAVIGETAPGTGGGVYGNFLRVVGLNNAGEVAFFSDILGGTTNFAVFVGTGTGVTKIAANGDPAPGASGSLFLNFQPLNYFLNSSGNLAFFANSGSGPGIWVGNTTGPLTKLMVQGDATGSSLGGSYANQPAGIRIFGLNNANKVLFRSGVIGGTSDHALFLKDLANPPQIIFSRNQPAPGGTVETLNLTQQASLNANGDVVFLATLLGGGAPNGWFIKANASGAVKVAFQGEPTPVGGTFGLAGRNTVAQINAGGDVAFFADVIGPNTTGAFHWSAGGGLAAIVTTGDTLPDGARPVIFTFGPVGSDDVVVFQAFKAGGRRAVYSIPLKTPVKNVTRIFGEGDAAPSIGGTIVGFGFNFSSINDSEEVPFFAGSIVGGSVYPANGVFTHKPGFGLRKVAATGDAAPGVAGGIFGLGINFALGGPSASKITSVGKVAFFANIAGSAGNSSPAGIFIGSASGGVQRVVRAGDPTPIGGSFDGISNVFAVNEAGQVAFQADNGVIPALFVGSGASSPVKLVAQGDPVPGGTVVNLPTNFVINNAGQVAYAVDFNGDPIWDGVLLGTAGGTQFALALAGQTAPGTAGGTFDSFAEEGVVLNNLSQVAFWAKLNAPAATTGFFLGSAAAPPTARLLEGQPVPGGGIAGTLAPGVNFFGGELFGLKDSGEMSMYVSDVALAPNLSRLVIASPTGALRELASVGGKGKGTNSSFARLFTRISINSSGRFFFFASLVGGSDQFGVFWDEPVK